MEEIIEQALVIKTKNSIILSGFFFLNIMKNGKESAEKVRKFWPNQEISFLF